MFLLHSNFNESRSIPITYDESQEQIKISKEKRIISIEYILNRLNLKYRPYKDWIHNSVSIENEKSIYRKGAIDLKDSEFEGILAINPFEGFYICAARFDNFYNSMQHGTGKKTLERSKLINLI